MIQGMVLVNSGIVDQDVDAAEMGDRIFDHFLDGDWVGEVGAEETMFGAGEGFEGGDALARVEGKGCACLGEGDRGGLANASRCACDQDGFVLEVVHFSYSETSFILPETRHEKTGVEQVYLGWFLSNTH